MSDPRTAQTQPQGGTAQGRAAMPEIVGNYRITATLGEGGMGKVYAARHRLLERPAAIKVLLPQYSSHPEVMERFFHEARAAAAAKNPGIVEIYDFGYQDDGSAFIAMEFLEGEDLETRLRRLGRIPLAQALLFTGQIAAALAAAHAGGIVHRDLKPANVFIVSDPQVVGGERIKILDFGIAKVSQAGGEDADAQRRTRAGAVMGTPAYMAPEQCRGAAGVDARADLYSVGCILFEMLSGRPPFRGASSLDVMSAHLRDQPPVPSSIEPSIGPELDALILSLLAKEPEARFQRAVDLERAMHMLLTGSPAGVVQLGRGAAAATGAHAPRPWYRRASVLVALVIMMTLGGVAAGLLQRQSRQAEARVEAETLPVLEAVADAAPAPRRPPVFHQGQRDGTAPPAVEVARADAGQVVWRIGSAPAGAQVLYREQIVGTTETPLYVVVDRDPARTEELSIERFGYVERRVVLSAGEDQEHMVELVEQVELTIRSRPSGALIHDHRGRPRGPTPGVILAPPGDEPLVFVLKREGHADETVEIVPDQDRTTQVKLTPLVTLTIVSEPPGADVWKDGQRLGVTPYEDQVPRSRDQIRYRLSLDGYQDQEIEMRARRSAEERVKMRLPGAPR